MTSSKLNGKARRQVKSNRFSMVRVIPKRKLDNCVQRPLVNRRSDLMSKRKKHKLGVHGQMAMKASGVQKTRSIASAPKFPTNSRQEAVSGETSERDVASISSISSSTFTVRDTLYNAQL